MGILGTQRTHSWRFGLHPAASGSVITGLSRTNLPVGEALRIEMSDASEIIHIQYYVATESGGWALWTSCAADDVDAVEAMLPELTIPEQA